MTSETLHQGGFDLELDSLTGLVTSLRRHADAYDTEYLMDGAVLGEVAVRHRPDGGDWLTTGAADRDRDWSQPVHPPAGHAPSESRISPGGNQGDDNLDVRSSFALDGETLTWTLGLRNETDGKVEVGDLALPLLFNTRYVKDTTVTYTQRLIKHSFIGGHGSFITWMRANGVGPYLVMTPLPGTKLEYYEVPGMMQVTAWEGPYWAFIHSGASGAEETRGSWRQPHTVLRLGPGESAAYGFRFRWADDYDGVRDVLYEEGLFDVQVIPGMTVPQDLEARVSIRTRQAIDAVEPEYPAETQVQLLGQIAPDTCICRVRFSRLGENQLLVRYGDASTPLEFFVTEPLETLIKKRAAFLVRNQQHRDADKWYRGLISQWDMRTGVLRGPDDTDGFDGWWGYVLACDDTALPKAPFVAAKNLAYPDAEEIAALETYIEHFVWGGLQRTDQETPHPYGIYGVPNWFENRNSEHGFDSGGKGLEHLWRTYDYPHVMMLYLHMYQIAKAHPDLVTTLDAGGYLERAYGTAMAYFTVQRDIGFPEGWSEWAYKLGCYNELLIVDLVDALRDEGRAAQAGLLQSEWEKKVKYFVYDHPYPFGSEMYFDSTAFETTHAIAKYGLSHELLPDVNLWHDRNLDVWYSHPQIERQDFEVFMERQIEANLACRGWIEPAYYYLGSDYRQVGSSMYLLSYMSQLGGWAILDYALYYAEDPFPCLRLGYNSYLSSWALMNTGTPESDYGYWYPGPENDGASGWAYMPEKFGPIWLKDGRTGQPREQARGAWYYDGEIELGYIGALRMAATVVTSDPIFGLVALGGNLEATGGGMSVTPRDGLRQRFHIVQESRRLHLLLAQDGFATEQPIYVSSDWGHLSFALENRGGAAHTTALRLVGLPVGAYEITARSASAGTFVVSADVWCEVAVPLAAGGTTDIEIRRATALPT